jgi:hypothetical protein
MHLAHLSPQMQIMGGLHKGNLKLEGYGLAAGYGDDEAAAVREHLLGMPWTQLVNRGYLVDTGGHGSYVISEDGWGVVNGTRVDTVSHAASNRFLCCTKI